MQHGTVLGDWWDTRTDDSAASSCWARHSVISRDFDLSLECDDMHERQKTEACILQVGVG